MFKTYPLIPRWSLNGVSLPSYRWSSNVRYSTSGQQHHLHGFIIHLACHRNARKPLEFFDGICDFLLSSWRTSVHWFHVFILFKIALLERKKERETEIYRLFIQQHSRGHSRSHAIKNKAKQTISSVWRPRNVIGRCLNCLRTSSSFSVRDLIIH